MPPNRRRGGGFGGSLLATPKPLPEDEPTTAEEGPADPPVALTVAPAATEPEQPAVASAVTAAPEPEVEPAALDPEPAPVAVDDPAPEAATQRGRGDKKPPSTIRLDDRAGHPLFDAFLVAKQQDPFLSYRQFASGIVLNGLAAHHRRQKRP